MFPLLKKLPSENNKIYSYRAIKEGILSLQLQPGQALSVVDLARVLKVSTTPIKAAMGRLLWMVPGTFHFMLGVVWRSLYGR